jgi:myo-inositol-1(or 4)-monophosphatase
MNKKYFEICQGLLDVGHEIKKLRTAKMKIFQKIKEGDATNIDLLSEKRVMAIIGNIFPESEILSEEVCYFKYKGDYQAFSGAKDIWLLDPIDGTNNMINGIPYYCIALAHMKEGKTVFGAVLDLANFNFYIAHQDFGARFLSVGTKKRVSRKLSEYQILKWNKNKVYKNDLSNALLGTCHFDPKKPAEHAENLRMLSLLSKEARSVRKMGSAAMDLCLCASGKLDGFWQKNLRPWDIAAAAFICEMSGLVTTNLKGKPFHPFEGSVLVGQSSLHRQILQLLK